MENFANNNTEWTHIDCRPVESTIDWQQHNRQLLKEREELEAFNKYLECIKKWKQSNT